MIRVLLLCLCLATTSHAAKLRQADLASTIGFLQVERVTSSRQMPEVTSPRFEEIRISTSDDQHRAWLNSCIATHGPSSKGDLFFFERNYSAVPDASGRHLLTIWTDCGFETIRQAIVVWNKQDDQLSDEVVLDHALVAGIGRDSIKEVHDIGKGQHVMIGRSEGGDGGEVWGDAWVGVWTEPRHFENLYSVHYSGNQVTDTKVEYHYDPKLMRLDFKQTSGPASDVSQWKVDKTWSVDVKEKLRRAKDGN